MHRVDHPTATVDSLFTEGSVTGGVPATIVPADWLNDIQENLMEVLAQAGIAATKGREQDLVDALLSLVSGNQLGGSSASDYLVIRGKDRVTGAKRDYVVQWGQVVTASNQQVAVTFPVAHTGGGLLAVVGSHYGSGGAMFVVSAPTLTGFTAIISTVLGGTGTGSFSGRWISLGYLPVA